MSRMTGCSPLGDAVDHRASAGLTGVHHERDDLADGNGWLHGLNLPWRLVPAFESRPSDLLELILPPRNCQGQFARPGTPWRDAQNPNLEMIRKPHLRRWGSMTPLMIRCRITKRGRVQRVRAQEAQEELTRHITHFFYLPIFARLRTRSQWIPFILPA